MKVAKLFVIGILAFPLVLTLPTQLTKIDFTLPECEITKNSLFCDFKESERDNVYLDPVNETIDKIYINNLRNVQLSSALCTNMALVNVGNVTLVNEGGLPCEQGFDLAAKDTIFDRMPVQINKIYLENCNVSSLITGATLTKLTVIQSFINSLDISYPLTNNTSFTFKESSIGVLKNLVIDGWPEFIMKDTNISYIPPEGLIVKHGVLSVKGSSFINTTKDSIIIYPNATLDLQNYSGNLKLSNMLIPTNKQVFSGAEESEIDFFYPFIICLSLLIAIVLVCLISLSIWYYKNSGELCYQHVSKDPSDVKEIENEESGKLLQDERLTCHVKSDLCRGDVGEEKQKNTTQSSVNVTSETLQQSKSNTLLNKDRNKNYKTEVDSQVNESKGNEMSSKIKEDTVPSGKRKSISNENEFSKAGKNRKEKASHPDSSDRHNMNKTNDSPITSVEGTSKRKIEDAKPGDYEGKDKDQTLSPANPPAPKDMLPEPEDMITDNVILFSFYSLTQKEKSDIPHAINNGRLKVGLKKNTYTWSEVRNEILSRNLSLSGLQVIGIKATYFQSIRNGDHLSSMNKTIIKTINESTKTGDSSLLPGQEVTKGYDTEARAKPDKKHIPQEVGNISTSEPTEPFAKNKNGSNGSNLVNGVAKGSNSSSENSSERNIKTDEHMISRPNQSESLFNVDLQASVPGTRKRTVEDVKAGDDEDKDIDQTLSPANPPAPNDMLPKSEDMITDNVILFTFDSLIQICKSDITHAISIEKVKVGLKKNTYTWSEVYNEILSRNLSLSGLQVIGIKATDFQSIRNGDHLSSMNKTIIKTINESTNTGASSLLPGQDETKGNSAEPGTNPGEEHITQEVGNISTSEHNETFAKNKNGSNGSNLVRVVAKGSNSLSENSSEQNRRTVADLILGPNQNKSLFNVDQQVNASLKNGNGDSYIAEDRDVNEDITNTHTANMNLDYNETGWGDGQHKLNQENHLQRSPELNPSPKPDMITEPEDTITDNVVLLRYKHLTEETLEDVEFAFKIGYVKAVLKKRNYKWDQIYKDILGNKLKLSNLPWMQIKYLNFKNINNGDLFSKICLDHTQKTQNPIPDGISPSTNQEQTKEDRLQEEHTKEQIAGGGDGNGSNIQHFGTPATEDRRSAEGDPSSGGSSDRKSSGENAREGIPSHPRGRTEKDSSGSGLHRSKLTEVEQEQENTITDNVVLFREYNLRTIYIHDIPNVIANGEVKVALKKDKYTWDRVYQDIYKYRKTFPNLPMRMIHELDFKKIKNGDIYSQISLDHTNKTPNPRLHGSSPSTSQDESKEDRPQGEHTKEHITTGGNGNGSNIQQSGPPATKDGRSAEGYPSSGGTSGRKSFRENTRDGNHSHTGPKTEKDSSGSVSHRSKPTEVEPKQENTITDNVVLFREKPLFGKLENDIPYAIEMGYVKVALNNDKYKWDRVNQDIYRYRETLPNLPLNLIHPLDFKKIKNGDPYRQIDFHYTNKASNQRLLPFFTNPSAEGPSTSRTSEGGNLSHQHLEPKKQRRSIGLVV